MQAWLITGILHSLNFQTYINVLYSLLQIFYLTGFGFFCVETLLSLWVLEVCSKRIISFVTCNSSWRVTFISLSPESCHNATNFFKTFSSTFTYKTWFLWEKDHIVLYSHAESRCGNRDFGYFVTWIRCFHCIRALS